MRFPFALAFLGLALGSSFAYPTYGESNSVYARAPRPEGLVLRELYEAYLNEMAARDCEDAVSLQARHHIHFGSGDGPSVTVHLRSDEFNELDARDYDDVAELEARHHGEGPSLTIHFRDDTDEFEELMARFDELLEERDFDDEDLEAREEYGDLYARYPFHPRIGTVILGDD